MGSRSAEAWTPDLWDPFLPVVTALCALSTNDQNGIYQAL